ncbi:MAG: hypothetical protein F6K25_24875 [Okeania sp. SIO2G4]|uniref:hypothetical protein n=1 Tax=unclassified Okeania TaxID=2634635 RepID=UPI0013B673EA|nr:MULTISPECIES: hypothetical protein [unclassified Okeania]NEP06120.1 hypothetical protein [Okeania sp. SIO4D6]NEP74877.1 hypothetical protein [Okeania sp. SIO2G5]NEP96849.1 hypothetical protein [Okeania sp. SIO2F5]NEQ93713.1 hypothetical protein [Okeania sp. SIO2G4]
MALFKVILLCQVQRFNINQYFEELYYSYLYIEPIWYIDLDDIFEPWSRPWDVG